MMNPWLFSFLISLLIAVLLVDIKTLRINIYGGITSAIFQLIQNLIVYPINLWQYNNVNYINIFIVGIAFNMGIIFLQILPNNLYFQLLHAFIWTIFLVFFKALAENNHMITFINYTQFMSSHILLMFLTLAWLKTYYFKVYKGG